MASGKQQMGQDDRRQGIALIIVLGMLAVMMVLGVAFVTAMRTERVAAGNFMEVMKARHLVYTALARAMDDIEDDLDYSGTPLYPEWYTNYPHTMTTKSVDLHTGDAQQLVPFRLLKTSRKLASPGKVTSASGTTLYDEHAEWSDNLSPGMDIERIRADGGGREFGIINAIVDSRLDTDKSWAPNDLYRVSLPQWQEVEGEGRIAYLVVDASGLLDGSYVGGETSRGRGANPREILVGSATGGLQLPDVNPYASPSFASQRDTWTNSTDYAYENLSEMIEENTAMEPVTEIGNISAFSRFPGTVHDEDTGNEYDLVSIVGKSDGDLQTDAANIQQALTRAFAAGASQGDPTDWTLAAQQAFGNLINYVDSDSDPEILDGPYVEATPLINEVYIQNVFNVSGDDMAGTVIVWVECAYPFVEAAGGTFDVVDTITIDATNEIVFMADQVVPPVAFPGTPSPMYTALPVAVYPVSSTNISAGFFQMTFQAEVLAGGTTVDRIPPLTLIYQPSMLPGGSGTHDFMPVGMDVIDPVYNWDMMHWIGSSTPGTYWDPYVPTPGAVNDVTQKYMGLAGNNSDVIGTSPYLHIANEPLRTIGELGYLTSPGAFGDGTYGVLLTAAPQLVVATANGNQWLPPRLWRSVWLYDHGDVTVTSEGAPKTYDTSWARMLDLFGQYGVPAGMTAMHGAVNPNTPLREVLASVFMNMQIDSHFNQPVATFSSWNGSPGALQLADAIQTQVDDPSSGPMDRLSELGREDIANAVFPLMENLKGSALSEMEKESFYRNAAGLLNPRQNVFFILLSGKSKIAVEQRALAVVWRDPIADSTGRHPSYIRWFTWLEE